MMHKLISIGEEAVSTTAIFIATFLISVGACTPRQVSCGGPQSETTAESSGQGGGEPSP